MYRIATAVICFILAALCGVKLGGAFDSTLIGFVATTLIFTRLLEIFMPFAVAFDTGPSLRWSRSRYGKFL